MAAGSFSAGAAIAGSQSAETSAVTAEFKASLVSPSQRPCDANHVKFRGTFEGSQTSSDARLTGNLKARVRSVVNTQNGYGYTTGKVRISDASTGKPKFHGFVVGVLEPDGGSEGFLSGRTVGPNSVRLFANFNAQQDQTGAIVGELGTDTQTGASQDPAVLSNACRGGRDKHEDEDESRGRSRGEHEDKGRDPSRGGHRGR
ncbi:MAG: hypothetical protein ACRDK0_06685 [Solirubrobacteraceae bacterium]